MCKMQCKNLFWCLFLAVISSKISGHIIRHEKEDFHAKEIIDDSEIVNDGDDPCHPYNPPIPNFETQRISERKCYEYLWINNRDKKRKNRELMCDIKKFRKLIDLTQFDNTLYGVVGGRDATQGEFPHMGAVGWKPAVGEDWIFLCGSSLISSKFLLTAAHCTVASSEDTRLYDPNPKIVRLGTKDIVNWDSYKIDMEILRTIQHPMYALRYFDIGLIELKERVEFSELVRPACLWTHSDVNTLGSKAIVTGWGVTQEGKPTKSPLLQTAELDFIESDFCAALLMSSHDQLWYGLQEHQICAAKLEGGVDACEGDSGGPLQVKNESLDSYYMVGVTSFGIHCAAKNRPGIYTRVSSFVDWIESIVWI